MDTARYKKRRSGGGGKFFYRIASIQNEQTKNRIHVKIEKRR